MKKTVGNYIILGISLAALIFGIVIWGIGVGQQFAKYNHGIHATDEGRWVLTCIYKGAYAYTCDHCHEQITTWCRF